MIKWFAILKKNDIEFKLPEEPVEEPEAPVEDCRKGRRKKEGTARPLLKQNRQQNLRKLHPKKLILRKKNRQQK